MASPSRRSAVVLVVVVASFGTVGGWGSPATAQPHDSPPTIRAANSSLSTGDAVVANADGRLEAFVLGSGRVIEHAWQVRAGGPWSDLEALPGQLTAGEAPVAIANADGRLEVFRLADDGRVQHTWQLSPGAGWHDFEPLSVVEPRPIKTFTVARNDDGRLELFYQRCAAGPQCGGPPEPILHLWQRSAGGSWTAPDRLGDLGYGAFVALTAGADGSGQLHLIVADYFGPSQTLDEWLPAGGWHRHAIRGVNEHSIPIGATLAINADGRAELFLGQGPVQNDWQSTPAGPMGPTLRQVGPALLTPTRIAAARNADGRLEIAWLDSATGTVAHQWQVAAGRPWSGPDALADPPCPGTSAGRPAMISNRDGRLEVFVVCTGAIAHAWQLGPGGPWSGFVRDIR